MSLRTSGVAAARRNPGTIKASRSKLILQISYKLGSLTTNPITGDFSLRICIIVSQVCYSILGNFPIF